jgi:hypothetical protein
MESKREQARANESYETEREQASARIAAARECERELERAREN